MALVAAPVVPSAERNPIRLTADDCGAQVRFEVIGSAAQPYEAEFTLTVEGGGNRSTHRGSARLEAGWAGILSTLTLGSQPGAAWVARLEVEPVDGARYTQELRSGH